MLLVLAALACRTPAPAPEVAADGPAPEAAPLTLSFEGVTPPEGEGAEARHSAQVTVRGQTTPLQLQRLMAEGDERDGHVWGALVDVNGDILRDEDGSPSRCNGSDFSGLMDVDGQLTLISQIECQPGAVYVAGLDQTAEGLLTPSWIRPVDFSAVRGSNLHCAGQTTPWGSHLASEEYETDARVVEPDGSVANNMYGWNEMSRYFPDKPAYVYDYGWMPELTFTGAGAEAPITVNKRYAMGRFSHEQGWVLPDQRSVYLTDDGTNGALYLFVADAPGDLSAGKLWAAKWTQLEGEERFRLSWVPLGHATEAEINAELAKGELSFSDLFDAAEPQGAACPAGFTSINTSWGHECLRLREGMEVLASRLETRRLAAMYGATTETRKEEGVAFDPATGTLYVVFSQIGHGLTRAHPKHDLGGPDHIGITENLCGGILGFDTEAQVSDTAGALIDSPNVAVSASFVLKGQPEGEACAVDGIANPDNIAVLPGAELLMIAEDTSRHAYDALWAYHLDSGELERVLTAPWGSEVTGIQWSPDLGGFGYLTVTFQREYKGETPSEVSVLGPFPSLAP